MTETYTNRHLSPVVITSLTKGVITTDAGWSTGWPADVSEQPVVGQEYAQEVRGFNHVTGLATPEGRWLYRRSDEYIAAQDAAWRKKWEQEKRDTLKANRADWTWREAALSAPLRDRLENFRTRSGGSFDQEGWGYELVVCELAALYAESGGEDNATITAYGNEQGSSGNQHDYAKSLARLLQTRPDVVGQTVSALSPITGDAYYEKS